MECKRCGHVWIPRTIKPNQCPKCKQYYYDRQVGWEYINKTEQPKEESKPNNSEEIKLD